MMKIYNSSSTLSGIIKQRNILQETTNVALTFQLDSLFSRTGSSLTSDCLLFHSAQEAAIIMHANVVMLPGFTCDLPMIDISVKHELGRLVFRHFRFREGAWHSRDIGFNMDLT